MSLLVYNLKGQNPYFNLAFEEFIFVEKNKSDDEVYLVFYENSDAVILGKNLVKTSEVYGHKKLPPVIRRASGGGSVVHFHGNLNYGLIVNTKTHPQFASISCSYAAILSCVAKSLYDAKNCNIKNGGKLIVKPGGISDLCVEDSRGSRKISGNSQARKKNWLLHHGTILYDAKNISKISQFLRHPPKEPDYRKGRPHKDFLITYLPYKPRSRLIKNIVRGFASEISSTPRMMSITPELTKSALKYLNTILAHKFR
jgi:lipoate-protein ligase A